MSARFEGGCRIPSQEQRGATLVRVVAGETCELSPKGTVGPLQLGLGELAKNTMILDRMVVQAV